MKYDYLIVGAGLFGSIFAYEANKLGKKVLVVVSLNELIGWFSLRNVNEMHVVSPGQLNTYDVLVADDVVFTKTALDEFLSGPRTGKSASAVGRATDAEVGA